MLKEKSIIGTLMAKFDCGDLFGQSTFKPKDKKIFVINGYGGVGKDTFVDFVCELAPTKRISVVDFTKSLAQQVGWTGGKTEKDRKFLSDLKNLIDDYNDKNYRVVQSFTNAFLNDENAEFLFVCMREKTQIDRYVKEYNATKLLVTNKNVQPITSNKGDAGVLDAEYDITIHNDGTLDDLKTKARSFVVRAKMHDFAKVAYVSHPFGGDRNNYQKIENTIRELQKKYPKFTFVSPVHCFGFQYDDVTYEDGINKCLWLLEQCDIMIDCDNNKTSKGCGIEREYCKKQGKPVVGLAAFEWGF